MSFINDLFNAGIIEQQDALELNKKIGKQVSEPDELLEIMYRHFKKKITGTSESGSFVVSAGPPEGQENENHQDNPKKHSNLLEILYKKEVIPEVAYQKLKTLPYSADQSGYFIILHLSMELMSFYRSFTIEHQLAFVALLEKKDDFDFNSPLDSGKKNKLIKDIKAEKLETYLDFFRYCHGCEFVNILSYQNKELTFLKKVVKIINKLCYGAFTITDVASFDEDFTGEPSYDNKRTTIVLNTGPREHRYTYTFSQKDKNIQSEHKLRLLLENLLLMVNQLLAGFNADYRLTGITNRLTASLFPGSRSQYAIYRFRQDKINILDFYGMKKRFLFNSPSPLFIKFPLSYLHIEYALYHFKKCGLLAHINGEHHDDILAGVYERTYDYAADLLPMFPNTVAIINRTVSPGQKPYYDFLFALNEISHGVLHFTEINDGIPEDFTYESELTFKVSFKCKGQYHELDCDLIGKEFSDSIVFYIINEIVRKEYPGYQLIQLTSGSQGTYSSQDTYLFMTDQQYEYLQSMKLIEDIHRF